MRPERFVARSGSKVCTHSKFDFERRGLKMDFRKNAA